MKGYQVRLLIFWVVWVYGVDLCVGGILDDASYGYRLPSPTNVAVWWCEATWKVGRNRELPQITTNLIYIEAARNEYEPFQIVLRPETTLSNVMITVTDLTNETGSSIIRATNIEVRMVDYVPIDIPSDSFGTPGWYPDPLVPITGPVSLFRNTNQPFWITIFVPKNTPAGIYKGSIALHASETISIPLLLRVYDFTLPDVTHTRTAFYVSLETAGKWHGPLNIQQRKQVWDIYMENFCKHRVSPYAPHLYSPITWSYANGDFTVDFTHFNVEMEKYLEEFGFSAFNLMGHKSPPFPFTLGDEVAFTENYQNLFQKLMGKINAHLLERGWLDSAYCYWLDEPRYDAIAYYVDGAKTIQQGAPGLKRLLTIILFPPPFELLEHAEILVPMIHVASSEVFKFQRYLGKEVWGYLCAAPTYPGPNFFIDHPAINHRIVFWFAEKHSINGILYWGVNYWTTNLWIRPKSFEDGPFGNGFLWYPPQKEIPSNAVVAPPIDSLRWELIREGIEDREYFWLLKKAIARAIEKDGPDSPKVSYGNYVYSNATALATNLTSSTGYCRDPVRLYNVRRQVAEAIEFLDTGEPFFVRHPRSRAVSLGETVTIRSEAIGNPLPTYQWYFNGSPISGATNSSLTLTNVGPANEGTYWVTASNLHGTAISATAQLAGRWNGNIRIISEPEDVVQFEGGTAQFSITAVGALPITYMWLFNGQLFQTNSTPIIVITNVSPQHGGKYCVIVSNSTSCVTSRVARLTVLPMPPICPPIILQQPTNQVVPLGAQVYLSIVAKGPGPISYQWYFNGTLLQGCTNSTLVIPSFQSNHVGNYRVVVSNPVGAVTSAVAKLSLLPSYTNIVLLPSGAAWRYLYPADGLETAWRSPNYDDSAWAVGYAPLGYGTGYESTIIAHPTETNPITAYFRYRLDLPLVAVGVPLNAQIQRDDGVIVYINDNEVFRDNLPAGVVSPLTPALSSVEGGKELEFVQFTIHPDLVSPGVNTIAVEVHQWTNQVISELSPLAWWHLDEQAEPWLSWQGFYPFSQVGSGIAIIPGVVGNAVSNGPTTQSWLTTPNSPELAYTGPFTVGGWFAVF